MKFWLLPFLLILSGCAPKPSDSTHSIEPPTTANKSVDISRHPSGLPPQPVCSQVKAEFLVTYNWPATETIRRMTVLLAPYEFNGRNLRLIFDCLSKANPDPEHLVIRLETDRSRVHIPNGTPGSGAGGLPPDPHEYDFLKAMYFRRPGKGDYNGKEYFVYSPRTKVHRANFKTVIIRESIR